MREKAIVILQGIIPDLKNVTPTPLPTEVSAGVNRAGSTWDSFMQLIGLVFLLIFILLAAYYTTRFVGRVRLGQMKNSNFQVIDAYRISQNKVLQIVKIANKYIVIAIGKDTVNYITDLDEAEVYIRDLNAGEKVSFIQTLERLRNNK